MKFDSVYKSYLGKIGEPFMLPKDKEQKEKEDIPDTNKTGVITHVSDKEKENRADKYDRYDKSYIGDKRSKKEKEKDKEKPNQEFVKDPKELNL